MLRVKAPSNLEVSKVSAEAVAMWRDRRESLRVEITLDLGRTEFLEEPLDEKTIRTILTEHGIEQESWD